MYRGVCRPEQRPFLPLPPLFNEIVLIISFTSLCLSSGSSHSTSTTTPSPSAAWEWGGALRRMKLQYAFGQVKKGERSTCSH